MSEKTNPSISLRARRYSILMPPPNLTGEPHVGHIMQHLIMDAIARRKRSEGYNVLFQPGVDHAGIQFEGTLNKLLAKENLNKEKLGREKWLERAWEFKDEIYKSFHDTWKMMNISADWDKEVFTLDPKVQKAVFHQFTTFWENNLLYKGAYIVQWCPKDGTAIENAEIEYEERKEKLYFLKYGPLVLATARPETKFGDTAMAVNPNDERYKSYVGKEFEIETLNGIKKMKVVADEVVDPNFGTGVIKVTPGHDVTDYEIGKRHNLPIIQVITKEGRLTEVAGKYAGMKVLEAREAMLEELKEKGILVKEEDYTHNVAVCERCKSVIEPLISEEWFLKMGTLAQCGLKTIEKINFVPENYREMISEWIKNIRDWCISRSLWWGHRIPVWYCAVCNPSHEVGKDKDMIVSISEPEKSCDSCGKIEWEQDEQILDTWFSSGLWPLATLGFPENSRELKEHFPWDFEISAPEIKFLWIARMIMISAYLKNEVPFYNMFFHGTLRDDKGRKFSKSLGNGLYPEPFVKEWGQDALRAALFTYSAPGRDGRIGKKALNERCKNFRNFGTKLKNIAKFIVDLKPETVRENLNPTHPEDQEILKKLEETEEDIEKYFKAFELHLAIEKIYNFIWHEFADIYIERSKKRRADSQKTLEEVLKKCLSMIAPFMPNMADELSQKIRYN